MPNQEHAPYNPATMAAPHRTALVLGGTVRTGAIVARKFVERELNARTASRRGADLVFDWDDPSTTSSIMPREPRFAT